MQLTYRGTNYQRQFLQSQNARISTMTGRYRGVTYYISSTTLVSHQSLAAYKYRGVDYIKVYC